MRRRPFDIENGIDEDSRFVNHDEGLAFEETLQKGHSERLERVGETRPRSRVLFVIAVIVLMFAFGRLYYLAVAQHDRYRAIAEDNRLRIEYVPAPRGTVFDRNGEVLAGNRPSFELVALPLDLPTDPDRREEAVQEAASIAGIAPEEIDRMISQRDEPFQSVLIRQNLDREAALIFHEQGRRLPGFRVIDQPIRDYYNPQAYAHLMGYVGKLSREEYQNLSGDGYLFNDTVGKTGLEARYEKYLRGRFGQRQVEVDARGAIKEIYGDKEAVSGSNLVLNIEKGLQDALHNELVARLQNTGAKRAAVIAMEPGTGRILAYISLPAYDNNRFAEGVTGSEYQRLAADRNQPLFNRAVRGTYPPGSTVKPMVALAALQEGVITERKVINDRGYIVIENIYGGPDSFFYGFNRRALGPVTVKEAIADSSDVFFYIVGGGYEPANIDGLGIERLASYYRQFKLHERLGVDLPGERAGLVPTPEWKRQLYPDDPAQARWYLGNTYHAAIGQGDVLATPLHVLSWTATIANDGVIMRPFIAQRVEDEEGNLIENFEPVLLGRLEVSKEHIDLVQEGMRMTVTDGTARSLNVLPIQVAGKTGSAQFDPSNPDRSHAWFAGYAPFDNPEIAIVVLVEDGGIGASTAVPVARAGFQWWAENR